MGGASLLISPPTSSVLHVQVHLVPFVQRRRQTDCEHISSMMYETGEETTADTRLDSFKAPRQEPSGASEVKQEVQFSSQ